MVSGEKTGGSDEVPGQSAPDFENSIEPSSKTESIRDASIAALKAVILEIEWEISDAAMTRLVDQTDKLKKTFRQDKIRLLFLQLLGSVGKYIQIKKATAHPAAVQLLNSVYASLENVFLSSAMSEDEKKGRLLVEVAKFNKLKELIARRRLETDGSQGVSDEDTCLKDFKQMAPHQALAYMLEEIKKVIQKEFETLRAELKS